MQPCDNIYCKVLLAAYFSHTTGLSYDSAPLQALLHRHNYLSTQQTHDGMCLLRHPLQMHQLWRNPAKMCAWLVTSLTLDVPLRNHDLNCLCHVHFIKSSTLNYSGFLIHCLFKTFVIMLSEFFLVIPAYPSSLSLFMCRKDGRPKSQ